MEMCNRCFGGPGKICGHILYWYGEFYVGQEDKGKLCIINGDAVGVHPSNFSSQKLHVGVYLLLEVEFECEYGG